jgi:hypothetical protein
MTREEHLKWCIEQAIQEMNFTGKPKDAVISMMSDLRKHPETNSSTLIQLCMMQLMIKPNMTRQEVINFLNGFN